MTKRAIAAYLWVAAAWTLGSVVSEVIGSSEYLGLAVGVALAIVVLFVPNDLWTRRISLPKPAPAVDARPLPLTQAR